MPEQAPSLGKQNDARRADDLNPKPERPSSTVAVIKDYRDRPRYFSREHDSFGFTRVKTAR